MYNRLSMAAAAWGDRMDSRDMECFEQLCKKGSMAAVADEMGISRQTLSSAISRLEMETGVRLFLRDKRGCIPTAAAEALRTRLASLSAAWEEALEEAREVERGKGRTIRFGCNFAYLTNADSSAIDAFRLCHPGVKVSTEHASDYGTLWEMLSDGKLDLAVTGNVPPDVDLPSIVIGDGAMYLCVGTGHRLAARKSVAFPQDIADEKIVTCIASGEPLLEQYGIAVAYTFPSLTSVVDLVAKGKCVALCPRQYLAQYLDKGCACIPLEGFPGVLQTCVVTRRDADPLVNELAHMLGAQATER